MALFSGQPSWRDLSLTDLLVDIMKEWKASISQLPLAIWDQDILSFLKEKFQLSPNFSGF